MNEETINKLKDINSQISIKIKDIQIAILTSQLEEIQKSKKKKNE